MTSELLRQVRVLNPLSETDEIADVLITDGIIEAVEAQITDLSEDTEVCDRPGLVLGPGLVDLYSHSGEPGFEVRETLDSLLQAAAAGGFTRLTLLPDTDPAVDNPATLELLRSQFKHQFRHQSHAVPQLHYWGALTLGAQSKQMTELAELAAAGVVGFADSQPLQNRALIRRLLEYGQPFGKPIALWCCDLELVGNGVVREGSESIRLGLPGCPAIAETTALAGLLECIEAMGTPIHLMRISTARSVELIKSAKARGLPITASATWMHLLLNSSAIQNYDPNLRLAPPLGNPEDQAALIWGLQEGILDAIAIDHTPYTYEEKTVAFAEAPPGAIGLELALSLLWQALVVSGEWSALSLWRSLSTNPARCLGQTPASVQPNRSAELTLFDPNHLWQVSKQTLRSRSVNTPWLEQSMIGRVVKVWGAGMS